MTEAQDIAVQPGAVWEIPEKARAYLLDLLQGGGVSLHVDFANLVLRDASTTSPRCRAAPSARHGSRSPASRSRWSSTRCSRRCARKRLIRGAAFRRRNEMILRILEQHTGESVRADRTRVVWGAVLPQDRSRLVTDEARLVAGGIHSRRTAAGLLDVADPDGEWERWLSEEEDKRRTEVDG